MEVSVNAATANSDNKAFGTNVSTVGKKFFLPRKIAFIRQLTLDTETEIMKKTTTVSWAV